MNIAILGSGLMGSALGTVWAHQGHRILFSYSRDFSKLESLARQAGGDTQAATPLEAVSQDDVILMAARWHQLEHLLEQTGPLNGKIIISCMLPMTGDDQELALGLTSSGAEALAQRTEARVVGAFNTVWSEAITAQLDNQGDRPSMFYVGDDTGAKEVAVQLIQDAGFDPVDAGPLSNARLLEPFGLLTGYMGFAYDPLVLYRILRPK